MMMINSFGAAAAADAYFFHYFHADIITTLTRDFHYFRRQDKMLIFSLPITMLMLFFTTEPSLLASD